MASESISHGSDTRWLKLNEKWSEKHCSVSVSACHLSSNGLGKDGVVVEICMIKNRGAPRLERSLLLIDS